MATDESVPELEDILEKNFSEMKIGEEHFSLPNNELKQDIEEKKKIIYQEKYSSENQTGTVVVKPIKATKEIESFCDLLNDLFSLSVLILFYL